MALTEGKAEALHYYTEKIKSFTPHLVVRILNYWRGLSLIDIELLIQTFNDSPELQKLFWSNGVRMMLVEEDVRQSFEPPMSTDERSRATPGGLHRSSFDNSVDPLPEEDSTAPSKLPPFRV